VANERDPFVAGIAVRHGEELLRYFKRRARTRVSADDLAQEVYLRLLRLSRQDLIRDPRSYVFRVAANLAHEFALKHAELTEAGALADEPSTEGHEVERALDSQVHARHLQAALEELSPKCRAVFILHRRDEMTYDEIARHLGVSASMVKKYLGQALQRLRKRLRHMER
jgi:RNA polymerase sigma factor (sigma-70 family)